MGKIDVPAVFLSCSSPKVARLGPWKDMPGLVLETTGVRGRCSSPVIGLMFAQVKNFEVLES
jgi:hypothetical protein